MLTVCAQCLGDGHRTASISIPRQSDGSHIQRDVKTTYGADEWNVSRSAQSVLCRSGRDLYQPFGITAEYKGGGALEGLFSPDGTGPR